MRWSLILLCLLTALCRAGTPVYIPVGTLINTTTPRDRALAGTPLTEWGPDTRGGWHQCPIFQNCNTAWNLQPVNATDQTYTENGTTYTVYQTSDPQIGVVYEVRDVNGPWIPAIGTTKFVFFSGSPGNTYDSRVRVKLVYRAAHSRAGTVSHTVASNVMIGSAMTNAGGDGPEDYYLQSSTFNLTAQTCTVSSSSSKIALGNINESLLRDTGSTGPKVSIGITFNCPENVGVKGYLVDILHPSNTGNKLLINEKVAGAAEGVAINIYTNRTGDKPLPFGYDTNVSGGINELPILPAIWMPYVDTINLSAQIVRTGPIKAGKINALLGLTFTYQ